MAVPTEDLDEQDVAEAFDEETLDISWSDALDLAPDTYDATSARGDEDIDGRDVALDADEEDDALLDSLDDDEEEDDLNDDDLDEDATDEDDLEDAAYDPDYDDDLNDTVDRIAALSPDEAEILDVENYDALGGAATVSVADLEADALDDAELHELGYQTAASDAGQDDRVRVKGGERADDVTAADTAPGEGRSLPDDPKSRQDALLDEGVEETFPASDPVSVKHIT